MRKLSPTEMQRQADLLAICKQHSGEYLPGHHGRGSWATTYSTKFVSAATDLCVIYRAAGSASKNETITSLYLVLREGKIQSCRGGVFTPAATKYLYEHHILGEFVRRGLLRSP